MVQIRNRLGMLACAAALSLAGSAHAGTFDLSYTFSSGDTFNATFTGTETGSSITGISNIAATFDGQAFTGALTALTWDTTAETFTSAPVVLSTTDASLDNFVISDSTDGVSYSNAFGIVNDPLLGGQFVYADDVNISTLPAVYDSAVNSSLAISAVVPEPSSVALLLAGLGLVGVARRRRSV